jgi:hypothetical protein
MPRLKASLPPSIYTIPSISSVIFYSATNFQSSKLMLIRQLTAVSNPLSHFKPMPQLATPPPDSPIKNTNGDGHNSISELSPFARRLYEQTDVAFTGRPLCHLGRAATNKDSTKCQSTGTTSQRTRSFPKGCSSTTGSPSAPAVTSHT